MADWGYNGFLRVERGYYTKNALGLHFWPQMFLLCSVAYHRLILPAARDSTDKVQDCRLIVGAGREPESLIEKVCICHQQNLSLAHMAIGNQALTLDLALAAARAPLPCPCDGD